MSLKTLVFAVLTLLATIASSVVLYQSYTLQIAAEEAQTETLANVLRITSDEVIKQTTEIMADIAASTQKDRGFKKAFKSVLEDSINTEKKETLINYLNQEYFKKYVTASIVKLKKVKVYDLNFNFIAQSTEGSRSLPQALPEKLLTAATPRKKSERLKVIEATWKSAEGTMLSILAPVGGLKLLGYIEVIVDPIYNLKQMEQMTGLPIQISQADNTPSFVSDNWEGSKNDTSLIIHYEIADKDNNPILFIRALQDLSVMYQNINNNRMMTLVIFLLSFGIALVVSFFVLKQWVFRPLGTLGNNLQQIASGNMLIQNRETSFISEIEMINKATNHVAENLDSKLLEIINFGKQLTEAAKDLDQQANRAVNTAKQQQHDVKNLSEATIKLETCGQEVRVIAGETATCSEETNTKALQGQSVVADAENSIESLSKDINNASLSIVELRTNIDNVDSILETIENIAEQTNLLALNAAIESARAGENGRGFAVVADEVRTLANRTQTATQEVLEVINKLKHSADKASNSMEASHSKMQNSVDQAKEARGALGDITEVVSRILEMNKKVSDSANEQNNISVHTKNSIDSINNLSHQVADDAENLTKRSQALSQIAEKLDILVNAFITTASRR